ncbi:MAG: SAM-dependent chlorinase/fluorinase [Anaerolineae bacterium]|nr:SAM-dependent chlorinase/fluorinase [Anaerolineae bacterium]
MALVTLTTDFGLQDGYVGTMKGVMAGIAPDLAFIDITHDIRPQDLRGAAYVLWTALPYFPGDAVHLVVVDPGVGTSRHAIASQTSWGVLVGPDNGVFSYVWDVVPAELTVALENPDYQRPVVSSTFHGRDVFSPAAAHIAAGVPLREFGPEVSHPVRMSSPGMSMEERRIRGEVLYIDRFGNVITSIGRLVWEGTLLHLDPVFAKGESRTLNARRVRVLAGGRDLGPIVRTYGEVSSGDALVMVGSEGLLEIAINQGHAARALALDLGDMVEIAVA